MNNLKQTNKRQTAVIAILSVLLVGLLAFNITYAFFTDRLTNQDNFVFGTIELNGAGDNIIVVERQESVITTPVMPGDVLKGAFGIDLAQDSQDAFVRYKLTATPEFRYIYNEDTTVLEQNAEGYAIVAYIDEEYYSVFVGANNGDVTIYQDGVGEALADSELKNKIINYKTYLSFNEDGTDYDIEYTLENKQEGNHYIEVTVTKTGAINDVLALSTDKVEVKALIKDVKDTFDKKDDIDSAIEDINKGFGADTNAIVLDGYIVAGDGWVYRGTAMTGIDASEIVDITYKLPLGLGNALQGVTINLLLDVQAVQAANMEDVDLTGDDSVPGCWNQISSENQKLSAIKVFYAALIAHGDIVPVE